MGVAFPSNRDHNSLNYNHGQNQMSLILSLLFFSLFSSAILRGKFSYGKADYDFHEHPIQFVVALLFIFSLSALCFYRFLTEP